MFDWLFKPLITRLERIIVNQTELAQALIDLKAQADKAKAEIVTRVAALEAAIAAAGSTSAEVDAAIAALKGSVQSLDDLNADPVPPPVV
jgi:ABC-type transporter Mla subunit MlaD